jgi:hypothetical protein
MGESRVRRSVVVAGVVALAVSGLSVGAGSVAAAPTHRAPAAAKITESYLSEVSVAPGSAVAYAIGYHSTASATTPYIVRFAAGHGKSLAIHGPAGYGLNTLAAGSAKSIWAVGSIYNTKTVTFTAVILHSTGGAFTTEHTTLPHGTLSGVAASSPTNAWVVGRSTADEDNALVAHWNGHSWKQVKLPAAQAQFDPTSVSTSGPTNVWMVSLDGGVAHWNGHAWSFPGIPGPPNSTYSYISTSSPTNAWAAGSIFVPIPGTIEGKGHTLTAHWNGKKWTYVKAPSPSGNTRLAGVASFGAHAYIVGSSYKHGSDSEPVAMSYSGGKWHVLKVARGGPTAALLSASESSKATVIAGYACTGTRCVQGDPGVTENPLIETLKANAFHRGTTPKLRSA